MGRKRTKDRHLPPRVYHQHNAYFFVDHMGVWHRMGSSIAEMYSNYSEFLEERPVRTMGDLFDRYMVEVVPRKAPRTQKDNVYEMRYLRTALAKMDPSQFRPKHGYAYYNARKEKSLRRAVNEMALLSHVFTKAVEWGIVDENPCKQIRKEKPKPRRRYVSETEYQAAYKVMPEMAQCAMDLAVLTALRPGDVLGLERSNLIDEGILVHTAKTSKDLIIEWSPELRRVVKRVLNLQPHFRQSLICNRQGKPYTVDGFNSIWYRRMKQAVADKENPLTESFQFRDLRAKSASDDTAEAASRRLGHANSAITERVYRRRPELVKPLR